MEWYICHTHTHIILAMWDSKLNFTYEFINFWKFVLSYKNDEIISHMVEISLYPLYLKESILVKILNSTHTHTFMPLVYLQNNQRPKVPCFLGLEPDSTQSLSRERLKAWAVDLIEWHGIDRMIIFVPNLAYRVIL